MRKLLTVALFALISTATFATGGDDVKVTTDSSAIFKVYYTKPLSGKVKIDIKNESGKVVFSEVIKKGSKGFVRPYNFSELPKGTYSFNVNDGAETTTFEFDYKENKASEMMAMINKLDSERVFMALSNQKSSDVNIKIYSGGQLIYNVKETVNKQFSQLFHLKDVKIEDVTFVVTEGNKIIKEISF